MSLDERFNEAAEQVKLLTKRPTDQELLQLYALFKQGTFGDNNTSKFHIVLIEHFILKNDLVYQVFNTNVFFLL